MSVFTYVCHDDENDEGEDGPALDLDGDWIIPGHGNLKQIPMSK